MDNYSSLLGTVIIGRNEGERLISSIKSILGESNHIVYVDSASTDNSISNANRLGIDSIELDMSKPFSAGRARNAGFKFLNRRYPEIKYVQFVDGDCEIVSPWLRSAIYFLQSCPQVGVVCGRRREKYPEHSVYNLLCNMEWDTPVGESKSCGGDFMCRSSVFEHVGGFNDSIIAGEEPEL